jgi:hypothetical protein
VLNTRRNFLLRALAGAAGTLVGAVAARAKRPRSAARPLFHERFRGRDRSGWGAPWLNQRYGRHWAVKGGKGIYRLPASETNMSYRPNPVLVLDHDVSSIDLRATISRSNPTARFGVVGRAQGYADYYACYLTSGNTLRVVRCGHHGERVLGKATLPYAPAAKYHVRLQVKGGGPVNLRAKAWPDGNPEPSRWLVSATDASRTALVGRGAFGLLFAHAQDGRGSTFRVSEVVAWSGQRRRPTSPAITYAFASPVVGTTARAVVKTAVPARVDIQYGPEPTLTQSVTTVAAGHTGARAGTTKAALDVSFFAVGTTVYWRAVARRGAHEVIGPTSSFRMPPAAGLPLRFAFGSCSRWNGAPHRSFEEAAKRLPDFYIHQGDLGYVSNRAVAHAPDCYQDHWTRMMLDPHFALMARSVPVLLTRDDEEYGGDAADSRTMRSFTVGAHGAMQANPVNDYFEFRSGDVQFFVLDCRRYSSGKIDPPEKRTRLGEAQKRWLKERMRAAVDSGEVGLLVVCSPMAFGSDFSPASWRRTYTAEWSELIDFFGSLDAAVLIVSGDAHGHRIHEYPQKNIPSTLPRVLEFQSAGTEQNKWSEGVDQDILVKRAKGSGFGIVDVGPEQEVNGQRVRTLTLSAVRSDGGGTHWPPSNYLIVRDLGILPLGV